MPVVSSLHIYPIKSCRGQSIERARFDEFGLVGDRRFLVVDERGQFLTQRTTPRMALIEANVRDGRIVLRAPETDPIDVPVTRAGAETIEVVVWRDTVRAVDLGGAAAGWLTVFLERPARLVTMAPDFARRRHRLEDTPEFQIAFNDGYPLLVLSEESLADLNARLDVALPMNRFRPNLVVRGCAAYDEDRWRRIRIGACELRATTPCERCVITTTDQETLDRGKEPLRTLAMYRRGGEGGNAVLFGRNYVHETKSGEVAVGMPIEILE